MLKILPALALLGAAVAAPGADAPATFKAGEFTFIRPAGWEWVPGTDEVLKAHLKVVSAADLSRMEVKFIHDPKPASGRTGSFADFSFSKLVENAWDKPLSQTVTNIAGHKVPLAGKRPNSEIGKPHQTGGLNKRIRQLVALVESEKGNVLIYCEGHRDVVDASEAEFIKMVETAAAGK